MAFIDCPNTLARRHQIYKDLLTNEQHQIKIKTQVCECRNKRTKSVKDYNLLRYNVRRTMSGPISQYKVGATDGAVKGSS